VDRVRDLYHKRVSDVRFLIPVLTGLTKKEVVAALPQLIKLNPVVVKEVFNRLLQPPGNKQTEISHTISTKHIKRFFAHPFSLSPLHKVLHHPVIKEIT
jgi:hypothetical protein